MKIAVMQPYLFPYLGYFQLINFVDKFVIFDDVNFIKRGWINRNYILYNGVSKIFTLPLRKASLNKKINETLIFEETNAKKIILYWIRQSYKKAPYYDETFNLIEEIIMNSEQNLSKYIEFSLNKIIKYIGIETEIIISSQLPKNNELKGQEKIIEICRILKGNHYINSIGGIELYSKETFNNYNIDLNFLKTQNIKYKQFDNEFVPNLSIIDIIMFNSVEQIQRSLMNFEII